jgi:hypothetical protein
MPRDLSVASGRGSPFHSLESGLSTAGRLARVALRVHDAPHGQAVLPRPAAQLERWAPMSDITKALGHWGASLCAGVSVGGLVARNATAHKWKAPCRSLVLRETISWRSHDLLTQAHFLYEAKHVLGSRILVRSALESIATLIYLNQLTENVLVGSLNYHAFDEETRKLLMGSRDGSTKHASINIVTVLDRCEKRYTGISKIYSMLSECPNFEGVCFGYSYVDHDRYETSFSNK